MTPGIVPGPEQFIYTCRGTDPWCRWAPGAAPLRGGCACRGHPWPHRRGDAASIPSPHPPHPRRALGRARSSPARPRPSQEDFGVVCPQSRTAGKHSYCGADANLSRERPRRWLTVSDPRAAPARAAPQPLVSSHDVFENERKPSRLLCSASRVTFFMGETADGSSAGPLALPGGARRGSGYSGSAS